MKLPTLKIGELTAAIPIIQGGMGVGVSLSGLAGAVAAEGGIGVISGAQVGFREPDFEINNTEANLRSLKAEILKAREKCKNGLLAVNLMVAMKHYKESVAAAVESGIDLIISGAGLPTELPSLIKGFKTKIAPIVSSGKAAAVITKLWEKKHSYIPDLVVVEGPEAGGHLGFSLEQLTTAAKPNLMDIVKEVIEVLKPYEEKYNRKIPVIAAGGIFTGKDIAEYINAGAAGVQMATRFVATEECDASLEFKMAYINSKDEDIRIVKSPVGMPGRAINNEFLDKLEGGNIPVRKCYDCLKPCNPASTPYCITKALIEAVNGNLKEGLIFTGSNAYRLDKIVKVKELMKQLVEEAEKNLM
jgi:NAD(P)H-dependent flavin oxidoreductase YrpB (nitropropane dioxygenase family)